MINKIVILGLFISVVILFVFSSNGAKIVVFGITSKFSSKKTLHDSLALGFAAYMSAASVKNNAAGTIYSPI